MRVLVACEFSGAVRDAFLARGHDALSCDVLPTECPGPHHQGDVRDILGDGWDLLIAHPPCRYLSYAAGAVWNAPGRAELREEALAFFMMFINAPIPHIAVENPVGYPNTVYRQPDQIIHPYYFGDKHLKKTCLWLKGLPGLWWGIHTMTERPEPLAINIRKPSKNYKGGEVKKRYFTDANLGVSHDKEDVRHARSRTFPGIAAAMAEQWGSAADYMAPPTFEQLELWA